MKNLLGMLLVVTLATAGYAQDPLILGNDNIQSSIKCPPNNVGSNSLKDMNNTMDMNSPLYMENGTLGDQNFNRNSDFNSNSDNFYSRDMNIQTDASSNSCPINEGAAMNNTQKSKGNIKGWDKLKHNKVTKHLFNQPKNSKH
jgi:hypothetical protein